MTTVREARINAALHAIERTVSIQPYLRGHLYDEDADRLAEAVVNALFTPDPLLDNVQVPAPEPECLCEKHGGVFCNGCPVHDPPTPPGIIAAREQRKLGINI